MISDEDLHQAIDRIARTEDGGLLYRYLQKILCEVRHGASDHTLREDSGRRILAADLMSLMGKGIDESGGRTSATSDAAGLKPSERPVVFTARQPAVAGTSHRGPARRGISPDDPELRDHFARLKA